MDLARPKPDADIINTALLLAATSGSAVTVLALINAGADLEAKNQDGKTALVLAAENGHDASVKALLAARPTANDNNNNTALLLAAQNGHPKVVQALIEHVLLSPTLT